MAFNTETKVINKENTILDVTSAGTSFSAADLSDVGVFFEPDIDSSGISVASIIESGITGTLIIHSVTVYGSGAIGAATQVRLRIDSTDIFTTIAPGSGVTHTPLNYRITGLTGATLRGYKTNTPSTQTVGLMVNYQII